MLEFPCLLFLSEKWGIELVLEEASLGNKKGSQRGEERSEQNLPSATYSFDFPTSENLSGRCFAKVLTEGSDGIGF